MLKPITTNTKSYRPDIDGLRAIAVLLVLFYHVFPNSITGGFIGVDIFFVISGYLISGIILNALNENRFSFKDFFFRRIKRIYPVLMLVLFTSYVLGWFFLMPKEFKELNKHILGGVGFVANFTLWQDSGYFDSLPELKPLMHLWSLGIEEQFYLVWPLSLFILWKFHSKYIFFFVFAIILSFITNIFFIKNYPEAVFYFPFTRFWELMMGSILALLALKKRIQLSKRVENVLSFLGFLFILIATIKLSKHSSFPGWWAILPTIGSVFIIQSQNSWLNKKILSNKIAVWIGLISYPLYLWHWLIISFTYFVIGDLPYKLDRIGIIVVSFLVAWFSFRYVESPIRHAKKSGKIVLNLISVSFIIGILSFSSFKLNGIPERMENKISNMPSELRELLNPDFGGFIAKNWREHSCFLAKGENENTFKPECVDNSRKPLVFIWGDSHAAALYSGFKLYQDKKAFGLAQYTASACPPILNWVGNINKLCGEINNHVIKKIGEIKPDIVILHASWSWNEYDLKGIHYTIEELKKANIKRILIVGQSPTWKEKVPMNIVSFYKVFGRIPNTYTDFGLTEINEALRTDRILFEMAKKSNVEFISIFEALCSNQKCLLSTDKSILDVTSLDQGHLSESAAQYFISSSLHKIFQKEN